MARELKRPVLAIDLKDGDVVGSLITTVEIGSGWIKGKTSGIVPACPLFADISEITARANGKDSNAVVQPIAGVHKLPVSGDQNLGAEITSGEARRQCRDRLPRGQTSGLGVIVKQYDRRAFFLNRIKPTTIGMKMEVTRSVSSW